MLTIKDTRKLFDLLQKEDNHLGRLQQILKIKGVDAVFQELYKSSSMSNLYEKKLLERDPNDYPDDEDQDEMDDITLGTWEEMSQDFAILIADVIATKNKRIHMGIAKAAPFSFIEALWMLWQEISITDIDQRALRMAVPANRKRAANFLQRVS